MNILMKSVKTLSVTLLFCILMTVVVLAKEDELVLQENELVLQEDKLMLQDDKEMADLELTEKRYKECLESYEPDQEYDITADQIAEPEITITEYMGSEYSYDVGEPNDYQAIATSVTFGEYYLGELGSYMKWRRDGLDADFFAVEFSRGGKYRIEMTGFQSEFAKTTCLINVISPSGDDDNISFDMKRYGVDYYEYTAKEAGKHYIKIYNYFDSKYGGDHYYLLKVTDESPDDPDVPEENFDIGEPNNSRADATMVTIGETYRGELGSYAKYDRDGIDVDFFAVYMQRGVEYRITVSGYQDELASTSCIIDMYAPSNDREGISYYLRKYGVDYYDYQATETGTHYINLDNYFDNKERRAHYYSLKITKRSLSSISGADIELSKYSYTYTGNRVKPGIESVLLDDNELTEGVDYTVSYSNNLNAGTAYVKVTGKGNYTGTAKRSFTIKKAANTLKVTGKTTKVGASTIKKKSRKISIKKFVKVSKTCGKVTYKKTKGLQKIKVSKTGTVTLEKGIKKGAHKVKVKVTAAGDKNHKSTYKYVTFTVNIK